MTFATRVLDFYKQLSITEQLPKGIEIINPYNKSSVTNVCTQFYNKYYNDNNPRTLIVGINPGRFGAGITGIPFTDPVILQNECEINNDFDKRSELSSDFVYKLINTMGGKEGFFNRFYIGSVSPLGFIKNGKNYNYYDSKELMLAIKPFIISNLVNQIGLGITSRKCYCFGQGKNYDYLKLLNIEHNLFDKIIPLPHPRWVMQYRRKSIDSILSDTISKLLIP